MVVFSILVKLHVSDEFANQAADEIITEVYDDHLGHELISRSTSVAWHTGCLVIFHSNFVGVKTRKNVTKLKNKLLTPSPTICRETLGKENGPNVRLTCESRGS